MFCDRLKKLRADSGMTQEALAQKLHVSRQAVSKWEQGKGLPDIDSLKNLSEIFEISLDALVKDLPAKPAADRRKLLFGLALAVSFLQFFAAAIFHLYLADRVPVHYDAAWRIDRYGSRNVYLMMGALFPLIPALPAAACLAFLRDKKVYTVSMLAFAALGAAFTAMQISFGVSALQAVGARESAQPGAAIGIGICAVLFLSACFLPGTPQNAVFGFRTSATMSDPACWKKVNFAAACCLLPSQLVSALLIACLPEYSLYIFLSATILPIALAMLLGFKRRPHNPD